jgi:photosystem II stability/assembly factor-like uncharacterized protein
MRSSVRRAALFRCSLAAAVLAAPSWALADSASAAAIPDRAYQDLRWRLLGPFRGGWATCAAGVPGDPATFFFGAADGGIWKTSDAGVTWRPIFDSAGAGSIGAIAIAPSDSKTIWVGTGQVHQRWDIVAGDGVYRSRDGGLTFEHVGLGATRHIGRIWVDPRNADRALVAALGHVFGPNEERGVFRTEDGGKTWTKVLYRDPDTGAVSLAADPAAPDVVYASLWQVRRHPWLDYFQPPTGAGSSVHRSSDGGRTWTPVGANGLPRGPLGRIELMVAPGTAAKRVFAAIDGGSAPGLYRSDDGGAAWALINPDASLASAYTSGLAPDPRDPEIVWAMGRSIKRSADGGRTFMIFKGAPGGDDYHFLWIDPREPKRMITGADQGAVVTLNGGASWSSWYNQPTGQFYRLAADDRFPYWVYSGQQDSGTVRVKSRSDYGQLTFREWEPVGGDERDADIPDPKDPDIVYGAGLGSRVSRWDARTGQVQNVSPWPVSTYGARPTSVRYRYGWITPLAVSKRPPHAIYHGAQVLFRSLDAGRSWTTVSPDLTGAIPGTPGCDGDVPMARATACGFGVIFAIAPSLAADGLVWVGTDNGRVQRTDDGGATWQERTPAGLADWSKVNMIDASPTDPATAYVAVDRHRLDDFRPMAYRTHDGGATWTEIGHGLPEGSWVGVVRQDPKAPDRLYAGTSRGVFVSFDDGERWQSLQLNLPPTGINDLLVHGDDLIAATQGRALWVLDGIAPLRHHGGGSLGAGAVFLPPAPAVRLRSNQNKDTPLPPEEARAVNPPVGAVFDYVLPDAIPADVLRLMTLEIATAEGQVVRRFASDDAPKRATAEVYFADAWLGEPARLPGRPGHNRFTWDLRLPAPRAIAPEYSIAAVPGLPTEALPQGAFVLPGRYEARLIAGGKTLRQSFEVTLDPRVKTAAEDLRSLLDFQGALSAELARSADLDEAMAAMEQRLKPAGEGSTGKGATARREAALAAIGALRREGSGTPAALNGVLATLATDLESVDAAPTEPQRLLLAESRQQIDRAAARWDAFTRNRPETSKTPPRSR